MIGGVIGLIQSDESVLALQHLGYLTYFGPLLGLWKLAGAIVITAPGLPRLKEWAYFLLLVLASWALRPSSRRLAAPPLKPQPVGATERVDGFTLKVA